MGLHIEISSEMSTLEWSAVAALVEVMRGKSTGDKVAPKLGKDADRPAFAPETVAAEVVVPTPPVPASEALLAAHAAEVVIPKPPVTIGAAVDKTGLPWDGRIHAATKAMNVDGTWRGKRNLNEDIRITVTNELRTTMAANAPAEDAERVTDAAAAFGGTNAPVAEVVIPKPPVEEPAIIPDDPFVAIMRLVLAKQTAGVLTTARAAEIAGVFGLPSVAALQQRPDLIPGFQAMLP